MAIFDVITLGETMLRLTPPDYKLVEQTDTLTIQVGGSESNTAVGLARLGLKVSWITRMTDNPLGRYIVDAVKRHGVHTSSVIWTDEDRVGLYFMEEGKPPRSSSVMYDRAHSAMSRIQPEDIPDALFQPETARMLHLTGITPAISHSARETTLSTLHRAKAARWMVTFDVNYRANLWSAEQASIICGSIMEHADVIFCSSADATRLFDLRVDSPVTPETHYSLLEQLHERYPHAVIVLTLGANGAIACDVAGTQYQHPAYSAERVDRMGGGDAFNAGFLYGYLLADHRIPIALRWGTAVAAIKYTILGDLPLVNYEDTAHLVEHGVTGSIMR
jgi:2-dehydro-3-deoxygluconokinase